MLNSITIYKFIVRNNKIINMKYIPVSCSIYDRIESLAVRRQMVEIIFRDQKNNEVKISGIINNVYSENKAEYLLIGKASIRLDKIINIIEL